MRPTILAMGIGLLALSLPATGNAGVSAEARRACERQAEQVRPALRAGEKEAWIANCLADATAGTKPKKKKYY
jgi:hypothetical protein